MLPLSQPQARRERTDVAGLRGKELVAIPPPFTDHLINTEDLVARPLVVSKIMTNPLTYILIPFQKIVAAILAIAPSRKDVRAGVRARRRSRRRLWVLVYQISSRHVDLNTASEPSLVISPHSLTAQPP